MILTLHTKEQTNQISIREEDFQQLRNPQISETEIDRIADACQVSPSILTAYVQSLQKCSNEFEELDGSCDYTDHM